MRRIWKRVAGGDCEHPHTVVITSVGVRRTVCHDCGHISFTMPRESTAVLAEDRQPELDEAAGL